MPLINSSMRSKPTRTLGSFARMILLAGALLGLNGCASLPFFGGSPATTTSDTVFAGQLSYSARIALPVKSTAVIKLYDGIRPEELITEEQIPLQGKQVPIDFSLHIGKGLLMVNHPYLLHTYLVANDRIEWFSEPITVTPEKQQLGTIKLKLFNDQGITINMVCGKTPVTLTNRGDVISMQIEGENIVLRPAVSASGARYVAQNDPDTVFWSKGDKATITVHGQELPECQTLPDSP